MTLLPRDGASTPAAKLKLPKTRRAAPRNSNPAPHFTFVRELSGRANDSSGSSQDHNHSSLIQMDPGSSKSCRVARAQRKLIQTLAYSRTDRFMARFPANESWPLVRAFSRAAIDLAKDTQTRGRSHEWTQKNPSTRFLAWPAPAQPIRRPDARTRLSVGGRL
jgi:hypothetical protein